MMLDHLQESSLAARIRKAIAAVILEGRVRTYDMLKMKGGPDVVKHGAASTREMGDAIIEKVTGDGTPEANV